MDLWVLQKTPAAGVEREVSALQRRIDIRIREVLISQGFAVVFHSADGLPSLPRVPLLDSVQGAISDSWFCSAPSMT